MSNLKNHVNPPVNNYDRRRSGSKFTRYALPLLLIFLLPRTTSAHEGPPFPLFVDQKIDRYVVSLWTDPDVGDAVFFVIVSAANPAQLPSDLQVQIGVQPASGRLPEAFYAGRRESVSGQVQY